MADSKIDANTQKVIDALNQARSMELLAIHQYMIQHYIMDSLDYGQLCAYLKLIAIDEMRHAEKFAERVEALGGTATCESAGKVVQPQAPAEIYVFNTNLEDNTVKTYNKLAAICRECGDVTSEGIFRQIILEEDVHLGYYQETKGHIESLGEAFLAKYAATSKHSGPVKSFVKVMQAEDL